MVASQTIAQQAGAQSMCPLPLRERAFRYFNGREWVRGTPHPFECLERSTKPSPSRGEGGKCSRHRPLHESAEPWQRR